MNIRTGIALDLAFIALLALTDVTAYAMPKAAEHEEAEVTVGADVAKPRPSSKATPKAAKTEARKDHKKPQAAARVQTDSQPKNANKSASGSRQARAQK